MGLATKSLSLVILLCMNFLLPFVESTTPYSRSVNDVGFEVTRYLGGDGNLFVSPVSIYVSLVLLHLGSRGDTREEIQKALRTDYRGVPVAEVYMNSRYLMNHFSGNQDQYTLALANGLFVQKGYQLKNSYVISLRDYFESSLERVDFAENGEEAKNKINSWAAEKTHNMVPEFLASPLDSSTVLALMNALYFKGTWKTQFNVSHTKRDLFYRPNGEGVKADLMELRNVKFNFLMDSATGYKFLEMPYKGGKQTMILALPTDESVKFPDLLMTEETINRVTRSFRRTKMDRVVIPRFKFEYESQLKEVLKAMGVEELFTRNADLSGMSDKGNLEISSMIHKTVIEVNEEGSEAAAVTGTVVVTAPLVIPKQEFVANRPFLFYILDFDTDIVLFAGRLAEP